MITEHRKNTNLSWSLVNYGSGSTAKAVETALFGAYFLQPTQKVQLRVFTEVKSSICHKHANKNPQIYNLLLSFLPDADQLVFYFSTHTSYKA